MINRIKYLLFSFIFFRAGKGSFGPEYVNPTLCTHIIYSWAHLDGNSFKLVPGNPELDVENGMYMSTESKLLFDSQVQRHQ